MRRSMTRGWWVLLWLGGGCGPSIPSGDGGGSSTTDEPSASTSDDGTLPGTTSPTSPGTSTGVPPGTSEDTGADSSSGGSIFIFPPDGGGPSCLCCDVFAQDCPVGEKCSAWDNSGSGVWNGTRCSPIVPNPGQPGDPCTVTGNAASGLDDCDLGSMCWDVDPTTLEGTCVALCTGGEINAECPDPDTDCVIANDGVLNLCLPVCDPLMPACPPDRACVPSEDAFVCMDTTYGGGAGAGAPCELLYDCQPGLTCRPSDEVGPPCDPGELRCCTPYCDLAAPDPTASCLDPGQVCASWWGAQVPPPGLEDVGRCELPP